MANKEQIKTFIEAIAPEICKACKLHGYKYPSAIIAQACLESAYGVSSLAAEYHNYFGMKCGSGYKGKSVNFATKEEYEVGTLTNIRANFRAYESMAEGVEGYFTFISAKRYANLKEASSAKDYLQKIKDDGYATSSTYVKNVYAIIEKYDLLKYDIEVAETLPASNENNILTYTVKAGDSLWKIAKDFWGNGMLYPKIKKENGLIKDTIYIGQVLKIPKEGE